MVGRIIRFISFPRQYFACSLCLPRIQGNILRLSADGVSTGHFVCSGPCGQWKDVACSNDAEAVPDHVVGFLPVMPLHRAMFIQCDRVILQEPGKAGRATSRNAHVWAEGERLGFLAREGVAWIGVVHGGQSGRERLHKLCIRGP